MPERLPEPPRAPDRTAHPISGFAEPSKGTALAGFQALPGAQFVARPAVHIRLLFHRRVLQVTLAPAPLQSRFGRRLLLLFVGCAVLPIAVVAAVSYAHVTRELRSQSERRLHQA